VAYDGNEEKRRRKKIFFERVTLAPPPVSCGGRPGLRRSSSLSF
jgi:hypothetical protein